LIELVVALAVIGLTLSFTLPRITGWLDRLGYSANEQKLEEALADLAGQARRSGRTILLVSTDKIAKTANAATIDLPRGWSLTVEPPIVFRYDGLCSGGTVRVSLPEGERSYRLFSPFCRPQPQ
jgi:type II secretory pathway pseudopilin PulG